MDLIIAVFWGILLGLSFISFLRFLEKKEKHKRTSIIIKSFSNYLTTIEYYLEKAYEIIHKDRILIYSLEATTVSDKEFTSISKDYISLVLKMMGPTLIEEFVFLYGNEETLFFNIIEFFNSKYEEDEIRKDSMDNLMSSDIEET